MEKAVAPHSSTLAWKIPWAEEPGRLQSMLRVGHDWVTSLSLFTFTHWRRKWQPTPVFLPGESQGRGSLVGCRLWGHTELDTTDSAAADNTKYFRSVDKFEVGTYIMIKFPLLPTPPQLPGWWAQLALGDIHCRHSWEEEWPSQGGDGRQEWVQLQWSVSPSAPVTTKPQNSLLFQENLPSQPRAVVGGGAGGVAGWVTVSQTDIPSTSQCLVVAKSTEMSTRGSWGPGRWDKGGSPWRLRGKWVQEGHWLRSSQLTELTHKNTGCSWIWPMCCGLLTSSLEEWDIQWVHNNVHIWTIKLLRC